MTTLHWIVDSHHNIMEKKIDQLHTPATINTTSMIMVGPDVDKGNGGIDTEATSESDATARYDYTGMYRLSMMYDESCLESSVIHLEPLGGYIALRPVIGDDYNVAIAIDAKSTKILTAQLYVAQCMDYVSTSMDQDEIPYDDIIGIKNIKWMNKPQQKDDVSPNDDGSSAPVNELTKEEMELQERIEHNFVRILTECDMIRFVGENLVMEGPKGAIECMIME
jgi:hypothetical protein